MVNFDLNKIPNQKLATWVLFAITVIISPYWFLFQFDPSLLKGVDLSKILMICVCIGFPSVFSNILILGAMQNIGQHQEDVYQELFMYNLFYASWSTMSVFYLPSIATLFMHLTLKQAIRFSLFAELAMFANFILDTRKLKRMSKTPTSNYTNKTDSSNTTNS